MCIHCPKDLCDNPGLVEGCNYIATGLIRKFVRINLFVAAATQINSGILPDSLKQQTGGMYKRCTVQRSVQSNCKITKKLYCFKSKDVFAHANIDAVYLTYFEHKKLLD